MYCFSKFIRLQKHNLWLICLSSIAYAILWKILSLMWTQKDSTIRVVQFVPISFWFNIRIYVHWLKWVVLANVCHNTLWTRCTTSTFDACKQQKVLISVKYAKCQIVKCQMWQSNAVQNCVLSVLQFIRQKVLLSVRYTKRQIVERQMQHPNVTSLNFYISFINIG